VPAHIYTVAEETTRRRVQAVGSLFPLEESTLSAEVEGRVSKVLADVGDTVKEGQALILLDERELQFEVERQQGLVRQVRAQLGLGPKDPAPRDARQLASVQKAEADRFDAQRKYIRAQTMFKDNLISQQQFDEAASRYQSTQATYDLALQEVERLKALLNHERGQRAAGGEEADGRYHQGTLPRLRQIARCASGRIPQSAGARHGPCQDRPLAGTARSPRAMGRLG
jgi:multidrug efflux pump subunit AcrA (membrane-fusion protein)